MKANYLAVLLAASVSTPVCAGGIDRSGQGLGALFESGTYVEGGLSFVSPRVSGVDFLGGSTGNVTGDYLMGTLSAKMDIGRGWSMAVVIDQPYGADLRYGEGARLLGGTLVNVSSDALLGLVRYRLENGFSAHIGARAQRAQAEVRLQGLAYGPISGYQVRLAPDTAYSSVGGVAYELPEIALRVSATYFSATHHKLATTETGPIPLLQGTSTTQVSTPRAVNLDFQTGVAPDTLVFAQMRWVNWSEFRVDPQRFMAVTGEGLIELKDTRTFTLGVAHRISGPWSGALSVNYEAKGDPLSSPLAPVNGRRGATVAAIYSAEKWRVTAGVSYNKLGDATLETGTPDTPRAQMSGNHSLGVGIKLGWEI